MNKPVSYHLVKLLRNKGFDNRHLPKDECSAPSISDVVMWLYEKHGIWIQPMIYRRNPNDFIGGIYYNTINSHFTEPFDEPTKAIEAAIEYTLNNLIHI